MQKKVFDEKGTITIPTNYKSFIYFLIKDDVVVYVGQTRNNLSRPFSHKDKNFNRIEIMLCPENELDMKEDKYILKYEPIYNKQINSGYKLITFRNKLRTTFGKEITIRTIRKIMKELNINTFMFGSNEYIGNSDQIKVYSYLEIKRQQWKKN